MEGLALSGGQVMLPDSSKLYSPSLTTIEAMQ